jgi:hypothetical protein
VHWKKDEHNIAFWPFKIAISHLEDRAQAQKVAQGLVDLVNRTWERREEIEPSYEMRQRPGPDHRRSCIPHRVFVGLT